MATWTVFYVKESNDEKVIEMLHELSGISDSVKESNPQDLHKYRLLDGDTPTYLVIGKTQDDWTTVRHNCSDGLSEWGISISKKLSTKVIMTIAQSVSSYYYFAVYENGVKNREIAACYSEDSEILDIGNHFSFEGEQPGEKNDSDDGPSYYFGFESIELYCQQFGLEIQTEYDQCQWTILKSKSDQSTVDDFVNILLTTKTKKPWWKIWS